jgi:hypothetical protein
MRDAINYYHVGRAATGGCAILHMFNSGEVYFEGVKQAKQL